MAARKKGKPAKKPSLVAKVREAALQYPGAEEHFPWGESVVKVKGKVFVFLGRSEEPRANQQSQQGCSLKLPRSGAAALMLPGCEPTGYGLGKAGWVSVHFTAKFPPASLVLSWLDESYRAVAPKTLVKQLDARP